MAHKPIGAFTTFEDYASDITNPETNETYNVELEDFEDDYRTKKEQQDDLGDYLRDRSMDLQHESKEEWMGAR